MPSGAAVSQATSSRRCRADNRNPESDAEGRLILCDALLTANALIQRRNQHRDADGCVCVAISAASTRACFRTTTNSPTRLIRASRESGDPAWRMTDRRGLSRAAQITFADWPIAERPGAGAVISGLFPGALYQSVSMGAPRYCRHGLKGGAFEGRTGRPLPLLSQF